ncbi:MAG: sugar phosphate nucleotidyltransferase, partial [Candidatus Adiutrix sp.]
DIFTDFPLVKLAQKHLEAQGALATLGLIDRPQTANVAVGIDEKIIKFREPKTAKGELNRYAYCGLMALSPAIFDFIPYGFSDIIDVFNEHIDGAHIKGWLFDPAFWQDMGTIEDYWALNQHLAAGRQILHSTVSAQGAELLGWNVVGEKVTIEPGATIENCVVWPLSIISAGAVVKNATICGLVPSTTTINGGVFCDAEKP